MRKCNAVPYEGNEPYIFISYSHKDVGRVYPVLEFLAGKGYRIWYDNGIHPGTDWIETIGRHLNDCAVFMPFISEHSLASHNCKNEFNFAVMENKDAVSVILEPVEFSMALKMQMASIQGIMRYEYTDYQDFLNRFLMASNLEVCLGAPNPDIVISPEIIDSEEKAIIDNNNQNAIRWMKADINHANRNSVSFSPNNSESTIMIEQDDETTQIGIEDQPTLVLAPKYYLIFEQTKARIDIKHTGFKIGRRKETCDFSVADSLKKISREHMTFFLKGKNCYVRDNGSINKTYLNGKQLIPQEMYEIHSGDRIIMASEQYTFIVCEEE